MTISIGPISRVFKAYQSQLRVAELNKKENIKTVQGQVDRVSISPQARQLVSLERASNAVIDQTKLTSS